MAQLGRIALPYGDETEGTAEEPARGRAGPARRFERRPRARPRAHGRSAARDRQQSGARAMAETKAIAMLERGRTSADQRPGI